MASRRRIANKKEIKYGPDGKPLCTYCGGPVKPPRQSWCSKECVDAYLIRRSPAFARRKVAERDHGVCVLCGLDTVKLQEELAELSGPERRQRKKDLNWPESRMSFWDMDHIVAVKDGGGECLLENLQTLCVPCHRKKTAESRKKKNG